MRIVLPVHHFPPRYQAGAELYTYRLARWLMRHAHAVDVICIEAIDQGASDRLEARLDHYEQIPVWRLSFDLLRAKERRHWDFDNPLLGEWFANYLRQERPDLVHFQAGYLLGVAPLAAAAEAGIPIALTLHDYWFLCPRITLLRGDGSLCETIPDDAAGCGWCIRLESRRYRVPDRLTGGLLGATARQWWLDSDRDLYAERRARLSAALKLPQAVIAPSRFLANRIAPCVAPDRLFHVRFGFDLERFAPRARVSARTLGLRSGQAVRFGFFGQIAPHKGVHLLIDAFRLLTPNGRPIELHIFGDLEARPAYARQLRRLAGGDHTIHFYGHIQASQIPERLADLDVSVTPSVWYENAPLIIQESHAAGLPVITAALGGMAELVRDGVDGLHFGANDAADLARQMQRLIDEPDLLPRLQAGVTPPRSIDDEMEQLMRIYHRILGMEPIAAARP